MKGFLYLGLAAAAVLAVCGVFAFQAVGQAPPAPETPITQYVAPGVAPTPPGVGQPLATVSEKSLPELIADLKELKKLEQLVTTAIKEKLKTQKKALAESENELKSLGVDTKPADHETLPPAAPVPPR